MEVNLESEEEHSEGEGEELMEELPEPIEEDDGEAQQFDITLAATHSYMGPGLVEVSGRNVLEAGWEGEVPAAPHHGVVFPGETVPMLINDEQDAALIAETIKQDKLFGLLFPDESGRAASGYGVMCEVFEAALGEAVTFKARAVHRFRLKEPAWGPHLLHLRMRRYRVRVLPELPPATPLRHARLASLDPLRTGDRRRDALVRTLDAAVTPWPGFVYEIFDYHRMRNVIRDYFKTLDLEQLLPVEAVSLSFWVASNLTLSARDRLALFLVDDALQRLHMECAFISRKSVLCCSSCACEIALREDVFAMSTDGVHANYTNLGGYMHDVVTVSRTSNTVVAGVSSEQYSWFPGYAWRVALCARCDHHVGWRFSARKPHLRPHSFYGLCRNYVTPVDTHPTVDNARERR